MGLEYGTDALPPLVTFMYLFNKTLGQDPSHVVHVQVIKTPGARSGPIFPLSYGCFTLLWCKADSPPPSPSLSYGVKRDVLTVLLSCVNAPFAAGGN